ncbi:HAMP domain-containing protein [Paenibacillus sp. HJL G12]|uniref:HAMP domain-containing protein n=1 Tax=Paenibacillus dendrobii TaxID=2691084 RepID=A0A7X3LFV2_9BACL|nr:sensor histidine kinase [Paenibacillus dendrobii]MWV44076.1 HAMP domain-containing protein [Paenibacillus dendrobii]
MRRKERFLSFGYKLMISYIVLLIVPVVFVGTFAYNTSVDSIRKQTKANIRGTLQQIQDNIHYKVEDIQRLTDLLYYDRTLSDSLRRYDDGWYSFDTLQSYLIPTLQNTIHATNRNIALSVYIQNDTIPEVYYSYEGMDPISKGRFYELFHQKRILDKPWFKDFPKEQYGVTMQWRQVEEDDRFGNISLLRRLMDTYEPTAPKPFGFVRITVKIADLLESVNEDKFRNGSTLYIENEKKEIIYFSSADQSIKEEQIPMLEGKDYLQIKAPIEGLNWTLAANIPNQVMEKDIQKVKSVTFIVCLIMIVLFSAAGWLLSRYFSRRVVKIVSVLRSFQEGDLHKRLRYRGQDEFNQIALALNDMGENMNRLIQEVYLSNLQKKEAELEILQAQINPHFLYNSFSSINRLAQFGEIAKIRAMVSGLAKFYRLSLNEGRMMISVEKELQQVQTYIEIQKIKYEDRLTFNVDVDEKVLGYDTVKLILQPFVENILEHAFYGDSIHIRITAEAAEQAIVFKVIDDGIGMNAETIRQIFSPSGIKMGYGIRNVDQRIKLQFGDSYGVLLYSRLGIGTTVQLTIPYFHHTESNDSGPSQG